MAQLQKGVAFSPGDTVEAADLNNLVDAATALGGFITDQTPEVSAVGTDKVMVNRAGVLHRALVSTLPGAGTVTTFTAGDLTSVFTTNVATPGTTPALTFVMASGSGNKFLATPASGAGGALSMRALAPKDYVAVEVIAAYAIDFTIGATLYTKTLPDNSDKTFTLSGGVPGQRIMVRVQQHSSGGTAEVHWTTSGTIQWPGGTEPDMSEGPSYRDIFEFICTAANAYSGIRWGANFQT